MALAIPTTTVGLFWQDKSPQPRARGSAEGRGYEGSQKEGSFVVVHLGKPACVAQTGP